MQIRYFGLNTFHTAHLLVLRVKVVWHRLCILQILVYFKKDIHVICAFPDIFVRICVWMPRYITRLIQHLLPPPLLLHALLNP